jgi:hypothetical protein
MTGDRPPMYIPLCPRSNPDYLEGNTQIIIKFNISESFAKPNGVNSFSPLGAPIEGGGAVLIVYIYSIFVPEDMAICKA